MNSDLSGDITATVTLRGRRATIEDVQQALDILRAEGIPDTFEVEVNQRQDREYQADVPHSQRPVEHVLVVSASRAAKRADQ